LQGGADEAMGFAGEVTDALSHNPQMSMIMMYWSYGFAALMFVGGLIG
jgi:hypothetical protein